MKIMRAWIILYICFKLSGVLLQADVFPINKVVDGSGELDLAISQVHTSLKKQPNNVSIMYNLGTLYLEKKAYAQAIFYLKQASLYAPRNINIQENLKSARLSRSIGVKDPDRSLKNSVSFFLRYLSVLEFATGLIFLLIMSNICLFFLRGRVRSSFYQKMKVFFLGICLFSLFFISLLVKDTVFYPKIVIKEAMSPVYLYPNIASVPLSYLQAGEEAQVLKRKGGWSMIQIENMGPLWIRKADYWQLNSGFHF